MDFSKAEMRKRAIDKIIKDKQLFIIGSPMCTGWSTMVNFNWSKTSPVDKERRMQEARRHLRVCIKMYKLQADNNRYFLHEHPASALSWKELQITAPAKDPRVHCVVADQCQYGLTTPAEGDASKHMPALKPTRFMTSSPQMAAMSNKRCPRIHEHQPLVGRRCAQAAFYPLGLIRAILTGMKNTALANGTNLDVREAEREAVHAVMNAGPNIPWKSNIIPKDSAVKLLRGGALPIGYRSDNFKPRYLESIRASHCQPI